MFDFISTSARYINDPANDPVVLTTLAELENSEPYPYAWVSVKARSAARRLVGPNRTDDPSVRIEFARALQERPGESIEDLLDRTSGEGSNPQPRNRSSQSAELRFLCAIGQIFTIIGWNIEWSPLISFLARQFEESGGAHTFVSFNYDLVLERGIQLTTEGKEDFTQIYGFPIISQFVENPPPSTAGGGLSGPSATGSSARAASVGLAVLKPHGSLNWLAPIERHRPELRDRDLREGRAVVVPLHKDGALRYPAEDLSNFHLPNDNQASVEPVILTPRRAKKPDRPFPFLHVIREREEAAILEADEAYVLGWSIPRTDVDQECLIRSAVAKRARSFQRVTVVNVSAGVDYYRRVQDIFGVERSAMRTYNAGFRDFASAR
jgi:hypothetical protein